jgi:16S rRNA (guanine527-N7)-methyltransferase
MARITRGASRETLLGEKGRVFHVKQSEATETRLATFAALLRRWSETVNLIAPGDLPVLRQRHIDDCLQLVPLLPPTARGIDLGSGAGFPGLVLAIAAGMPFDLIESDQRKAAFLREAARATGAPVTIHASRIERAAVQPAGVVTARALAPLPRLLGLATPKLADGGVCLFPKGASAETELTDAAREWHMNVERFPSRTDRSAQILRISEIARAERG